MLQGKCKSYKPQPQPTSTRQLPTNRPTHIPNLMHHLKRDILKIQKWKCTYSLCFVYFSFIIISLLSFMVIHGFLFFSFLFVPVFILFFSFRFFLLRSFPFPNFTLLFLFSFSLFFFLLFFKTEGKEKYEKRRFRLAEG